jgi:hypothetical protein
MRDHTAANGLVTENAIEHKPFWWLIDFIQLKLTIFKHIHL